MAGAPVPPAPSPIRSCGDTGAWPGSCRSQIGPCIVCRVYFHPLLAAEGLGTLGEAAPVVLDFHVPSCSSF